MMEIIWKISVLITTGLCLFATLLVGLVWAAPRLEAKLMDRPRQLMIINISISLAAWLLVGYVGYFHTPEGVVDQIAQWGGRVLFIGAPVLVIATISYFYFTNEEERS